MRSAADHRFLGGLWRSPSELILTPLAPFKARCEFVPSLLVPPSPVDVSTRQQNHGQSGSPNRMFPSYPDAQPGQETGMATPAMFHNPSLEKQMAALNAANIAKMANRSAPGSAQSPVLAQSSSGYFGGNSLLYQSNGNMTAPNLAIPSPTDQHLQSSSLSDFSAHQSQQQGPGPGLSIFQQNMNVQPPSSMSIATPISAAQQNAFPDPNNRSTPVPNQQAAQMQMHKRKQFIQTLGSLMIQRNQPLPQALTGVPIPPGIDPNASPWKNLEPSQTEVGAIRLAGKDFDLYKFFGIVFQNGGAMKVRIPSPHFSRRPFPSARREVTFPSFHSPYVVSLPIMTSCANSVSSPTYLSIRPTKQAHGTTSHNYLNSLSNFPLHTLVPPPSSSHICT